MMGKWASDDDSDDSEDAKERRLKLATKLVDAIQGLEGEGSAKSWNAGNEVRVYIKWGKKDCGYLKVEPDLELNFGNAKLHGSWASVARKVAASFS